jgi:hypothetical protein
MSALREAVQQALEALESCSGVPHWPALQPTITALRAALTEDALQRLTDANQEIEAALEQPEQEPVATVAMDVSGAHLSWDGQYLGQRPDMKIAMLLKDLPVGTLLYTHPPRREWRGLTEEEIKRLSINCYDGTLTDPLILFARAIVRAAAELGRSIE